MLDLLLVFFRFVSHHRFLRAIVVVLSFASLFAATWVYVGIHIFPGWWAARLHSDLEFIAQPLLPAITISGAVLAFMLLSFTRESKIAVSGLELELEPIRKEREAIRERIDQEAVPKIFDTIQLGLNQIEEYYTINKSQARNSFIFSVFSVLAGLSTLVAGVWLFYFGKSQNLQLATLSGIGGLLLQFIGGASFYIYSKSLDQLNFFYGKLIRMQDTMLSIQLCNSLEDKTQQDLVRERLIVEIITRHRNLEESDGSLAVVGKQVKKKKQSTKPPAIPTVAQ